MEIVKTLHVKSFRIEAPAGTCIVNVKQKTRNYPENLSMQNLHQFADQDKVKSFFHVQAWTFLCRYRSFQGHSYILPKNKRVKIFRFRVDSDMNHFEWVSWVYSLQYFTFFLLPVDSIMIKIIAESFVRSHAP